MIDVRIIGYSFDPAPAPVIGGEGPSGGTGTAEGRHDSRKERMNNISRLGIA